MGIPNVPANFLVQSGNGQVYLSWEPTLGATSASSAVGPASTGMFDVLQSIDGINYGVLSSVNALQYYDSPSTGLTVYYSVRANGNSGQSQMAQPISTTVVNFGQTTLGLVRQAAQERSDLVSNDFVSKGEWNSYINKSYTELYDILVQTYSDEYFVANPYYFNTDGRNPALYALPSDMYKLMGVDLALSPNGSTNSNGWLTLQKFGFISRNRYIYGNTPVSYLGILNLRYRLVGSQIEFVPNPQANQGVRLWYIPRPRTLLADSDTLDGVSGWEEYVIVDSAIKAMQKEESDVSILMAQKQALMVRITAAASNRDEGQGECATDLRRIDGSYWGEGAFGGPNGGT